MNGDLAYDVVNLRPGGGGMFQPHCRVRCSNCTGPASTLEFALVTSTPPEHVAKKIRSKGWEFDLRNRRYTRCPECIRVRDASRKGESPGPKQVPVELFGKKVELPVNVVPPELVPPPPPVREPVVFKPTPPVETPTIPLPTTTEIVALIAALKGRDARDLEMIGALKGMGDSVRELVATLNEMMPRLLAAIGPTQPVTQHTKVVAKEEPALGERAAKSDKIRKTFKKKSEDYTKRVRDALRAIRKTKSNGREPSMHEYIVGLRKMNIEPFRPGRPWSATIVQKHLDAIDAN